MSDLTAYAMSPLSAAEIETEASAWLEQRSSGSWCENDQAALDAWLGQSPHHEVAYMRLSSAWRYADRLAAFPHLMSENPENAARPTIWPVLLRLAAAVAILALVGGGIVAMVPRPHDRTYATGVGGHEVVSFADGSKIELNTDTVVRARMTTSERILWLEKGEAYFEVKHDPAHPFYVVAGRHRITDLGTKFLVRRDPDRLEVALLEGRVRVGSSAEKSRSPSTLLMPDEALTATGSTMFVTREPANELAKELSWRRGVLIFKHTTLADAANEFNRYNRQKLLIADPAVAQLRIYGTFQTTNVRAFTDAAREIFGLHTQDDGDEIVISR
ncbi:MAG TPA: FecR domain-containing protein [Rhizomicrobium sp.]|nr:FecR domain-containing protein [Rhizomicrobium sp.]